MNKLKSILDVCMIITGLSSFIHFIIVGFLLIWSKSFFQQETPLIIKTFFSSAILFVVFGLLNAITD